LSSAAFERRFFAAAACSFLLRSLFDSLVQVRFPVIWLLTLWPWLAVAQVIASVRKMEWDPKNTRLT
jgi:hypothetical protein